MGLLEDTQKLKTCKLLDGSTSEYHAMSNERDDNFYTPDRLIYLGEGVPYFINNQFITNLDINNPANRDHFYMKRELSETEDLVLRERYPANVEGSKEFNDAAEFDRAFDELHELIEMSIAPEILKGHNLTVEKIVQDTIDTKNAFELQCDLITILAGEIPYYIKYGMTALETGMVNKYKK